MASVHKKGVTDPQSLVLPAERTIFAASKLNQTANATQ